MVCLLFGLNIRIIILLPLFISISKVSMKIRIKMLMILCLRYCFFSKIGILHHLQPRFILFLFMFTLLVGHNPLVILLVFLYFTLIVHSTYKKSLIPNIKLVHCGIEHTRRQYNMMGESCATVNDFDKTSIVARDSLWKWRN